MQEKFAPRRRLLQDFRKFQNNPPESITAAPEADNLMKWVAVIFGSEGTPWNNGIFKLTLKFNDEYPKTPPEIRFITPIFHPNIGTDGNFSSDLIQCKSDQGKISYDLINILQAIKFTIHNPIEDPKKKANEEAFNLLFGNNGENANEYERRVILCVQETWNQISSYEL